jgi:predicted DCC family thiol-disulfide oxidoreductase YuxK
MITRLTVLYDAACALCVRCRDFLESSASFVPFELLACQSDEARERYGAVPWLGEELVVASDEGDVWVGAAAFLVCLWALREHREWSYRLSGPALAPLAERFFVALSSQRSRVASFMRPPTRCDDHGACRLPHAPQATYR